MASPSKALLEIMQRDQRPWSVAELCEAAGLATLVVSQALRRMNINGVIRHVQGRRYEVTEVGAALSADAVAPGWKAGRSRAPEVRGGIQGKVWRALRMAKKATVPELLEMMDVPLTKGSRSNVRQYLKALRDHGIVRLSRFRAAGNEMIHALDRDLGPAAPQWSAKRNALLDAEGVVIPRPEEAADAS